MLMKAQDAAELLIRVRERQPLVHNITNYVAMDLTANVLLAVGASPAMVHAEAEVEEFAGIADSLVVNLGTLSPAWLQSMQRAAAVAHERGIPWVLDPVAAGATRYRTEAAQSLLALRPTVIRGNASEIMTLAGIHGARPKGVDSSDDPGAAIGAAQTLARSSGAVVAVTGVTDYVTDGETTWQIDSGDQLMARVTATGCSVTAVAGAFLAVSDRPLSAATAALAVFGAAGRSAARHARAPGSFRTALIDELALLDADSLAQNAAIRSA